MRVIEIVMPVLITITLAAVLWRGDKETDFEHRVQVQHHETHAAINQLAAGLMAYSDKSTDDRYRGTDAFCDWVNHLANDHGAEVPHETITQCAPSGVLNQLF